MTRSTRIGVLAVVALAAATAPAIASPRLIAHETHLTPVSALDGTVVWSHFNGSGNRFELMFRAGGVTRALPVASRRVPFDASLGHDASGRLVVLYSRCGHEADLYTPASDLPIWARGTDCNIYRLSVAAGHETRIGGARSEHRNPAMPVQWGNRVAFVATDPTVGSAQRQRTRLYEFDGKAVHALPNGPSNVVAEGEPTYPDAAAGATALVAYGSRVAAAWRSLAPSKQCPPDAGGADILSQVRVLNLTSRTTGRVIADDCKLSTPTYGYATPSLTATSLFYSLQTKTTPGRSTIIRRDLATGAVRQATLPLPVPRILESFSQDASTSYFVLGGKDAYIYTDRLSFTAAGSS